jgi:hypothetical protein
MEVHLSEMTSMARHKLSGAAKERLRANLKALAIKGKAAWSSLVELGKKYRVSPETVRWHLKAIRGGAPPARAPKLRKEKAPSPHIKRAHASPLNGVVRASTGLLALAERYGEDGLRRAIRAARLLPRWKSKLRKLRKLRRAEVSVKRSIRAVSVQAADLGRKIKSLTKA